ncbi:MAG: tetratricopeptide repeat protein [Clostridiaceae bacterium]
MEYFRKANKYFSEQEYKRAVEIYNKAIQNKEHEIDSLYNIGLCYIKLKEFNKAIPILKVVTMKQPKGRYFFNLAYAYVKIENFKKALMYFNTAWALSPDDKDCEIMINYILRIYRRERLE